MWFSSNRPKISGYLSYRVAARNTIKGHCSVSADATCLIVPPQGHVLKTDQPVWFVCAVTDCWSTKASKSVTEARLPSGPVVPSHRAPILSPSSRLFGTTRSGSCTQSSEIKVYLCQGANRPNSLEQGGVSKVVGGRLRKNPVKFFSSLCLISPSFFLAKDEKQQSCQMTVREKRRE